MERPTFSPFWHRLRSMTPRLRSHVQVTRQFYRAKRWFIAHDPTSNQHYRLSPTAYDLIGTLDGRRTVEEAWKISLSKFGDDAPTQPEVIELLAQLYNSNLLQVDTTPETEQLLRRGRTRTEKRLAQQAISVMYFKLRLINPEVILSAMEPIFRPILNRWGLLAWAALVLYAITQLLPQWSRITEQTKTVTNPANWLWIGTVFVLLKLWHEFGHGIVCKRLGGNVPEMGVMLLVLLPSPYVDATSAWTFPNRWHRAAVGAGGMLFELFAAAVAAIVWLNVQPGTLPSQLAFYTMFSASVATVLFNANPLMKFDGYYILSDLLEIPNLMQRSQQVLKNIFLRHLYRVENVKPAADQPGERVILFTYGILSQIYRVVVFLSITLWLVGLWFGVGLLLALWTAAAWFIIPVGMFIHWLASSPNLIDKRPRAIALTLLLAVGAALLVGVVPLPDYRRATGIVDAQSRAGVFTKADGFVRQVHAKPGDRVAAGDVIATLESPELLARTAQARAQVAELQAQLRAARVQDDAVSEQIIVGQLAVANDTITELLAQAEELTVRAPHPGVIASGDPASNLGKLIRKGEPVCLLLEPASARVLALLDQTEAAWLFDLPPEQQLVKLRLASDIPTIINAHVDSIVPAGQSVLPHPSLGYMGGGSAEVDTAQDPSGRIAKGDRFTVYIRTPEHALDNALPGQRVYLRFSLPNKPIAQQVVDRISKAVQGRVNL